MLCTLMAKLTQQPINAFICCVAAPEGSYSLGPSCNQSLHQYWGPDDINGQTCNTAGPGPVTPFGRYKEAVLRGGIHFLVYFLQKQEHHQHAQCIGSDHGVVDRSLARPASFPHETLAFFSHTPYRLCLCQL